MLKIDKQAHLLAGAAIAGLLVSYGTSPVVAFLVASAVALAKEVYDSFGYGTPDKWDFVVTVLGAATVLPLLIL
jgi:hypothetical protein